MGANADFTMTDFKEGGPLGLRQSDVDAFPAGTVRVVELPKGFRLFKLSAGVAPEHPRYGVTPWWSPVMPYEEDYEGAVGRYKQAKLNKIDMSSMVRYMSAVCLDWNDLDNYIEVQSKEPLTAFWGQFAPQPKWFDENKSNAVKEKWVGRGGKGAEAAVMPEELGVLEAWQFFIPKLKDAHIERCSVLPAHDMTTLGMHFGLA